MTFWVEHGLHFGLVAVPSAAMGAGLLVERRHGRAVSAGTLAPRDAMSPYNGAAGPVRADPGALRSAGHSLALPLVVASATCAALVHLAVMPEHFDESFLFGFFFLTCAILQVGWAFMVAYRPSRSLLIAGALGSAATVLLWIESRTLGIPSFLGGGEPEAVGALDILASAFEFVSVAAVMVALKAVSLSGESLRGESPAKWPTTAKAIGMLLVCVTAGVAIWAPVE